MRSLVTLVLSLLLTTSVFANHVAGSGSDHKPSHEGSGSEEAEGSSK